MWLHVESMKHILALEEAPVVLKLGLPAIGSRENRFQETFVCRGAERH